MRSGCLWWIAGVLVLVIIGGVASAAGGYLWYESALKPVSPSASSQVVTIDQGAGSRAILKQLKDSNLIRSRQAADLYLRIHGWAGQLKAGEYKLSASEGTPTILGKLRSGSVIVHSFTIPEGWRAKQVKDYFVKQGLASAAEMDQLLQDRSLVSQWLPAQAKPDTPLEGFLFPSTYEFTGHPPAKDLVKMMIQQFQKQYAVAARDLSQSPPLSIYQEVILASIVQAEAADPVNAAKVASVYYNRLKRGMLLDADPTVRYATGNFDQPLTQSQLKTKSPYNTYVVKGLPPGPINNPGLMALKAVLHPAGTKYLYFVADSSGHFYYSTTYKQHLANVRKARQASK